MSLYFLGSNTERAIVDVCLAERRVGHIPQEDKSRIARGLRHPTRGEEHHLSICSECRGYIATFKEKLRELAAESHS